MTFVPTKSHTWLGIVEVILTFLQKNSIDVKYCRGQSHDNASNILGKYKGVQQMVKDVCSYTEFCPCFAHSLNLVGSCSVEANTAVSNLFLMIQQLYKFFNSSIFGKSLKIFSRTQIRNTSFLLSNVCQIPADLQDTTQFAR